MGELLGTWRVRCGDVGCGEVGRWGVGCGEVGSGDVGSGDVGSGDVGTVRQKTTGSTKPKFPSDVSGIGKLNEPQA
jgi:hypothetical protein